jgi:hypothetical protein
MQNSIFSTFLAIKFIQRESQVTRRKNELKFLFIKEEDPNKKLYQIHKNEPVTGIIPEAL